MAEVRLATCDRHADDGLSFVLMTPRVKPVAFTRRVSVCSDRTPNSVLPTLRVTCVLC